MRNILYQLYLPINASSKLPKIGVERQMFNILFLQVSFIKWLQWWAMDTAAICSMSTPVKEMCYEFSLFYNKCLLVLQVTSILPNYLFLKYYFYSFTANSCKQWYPWSIPFSSCLFLLSSLQITVKLVMLENFLVLHLSKLITILKNHQSLFTYHNIPEEVTFKECTSSFWWLNMWAACACPTN
jgi:hypothetical protein